VVVIAPIHRTHQAVMRVMEAARVAAFSQVNFTAQATSICGPRSAPLVHAAPWWLLWPASVLFGILATLRRLLYRLRILGSRHPAYRWSWSHLTAGGTGKTPLVIWDRRTPEKKRMDAGIVSRGYGAKAGNKRTSPRAATIADDAAEVGDEPILLSRAAAARYGSGRSPSR